MTKMRTSALLVALLACAAAVAEGAPCDAVSCGMGTCKALQPPPVIPLLPAYECDCYPGWGNLLAVAASTPCYLPKCSLGGLSCYMPGIKVAPPGSNLTLHPCLGTDCGPGTCLENPLRCQCNPGAVNLVGNPAFPCTNEDCVLDKNGCQVSNPPPSPTSPSQGSSAPPGNDTSSSGATAPSSTKGSVVCLQNLLLLAWLSALHAVVV